MIHRTFQGALLAAAIVMPGAAFANAPAPGSANTVQSPRDPASGQATTQIGDTATHEVGHVSSSYNPKEVGIDRIRSPRDPASGQATGVREGGVNDTTFRQSTGTRRQNGALINNENVTGARGTATAQTGQWVGGSDDGSSIRRKPPGNRPRKGRRMHRP